MKTPHRYTPEQIDFIRKAYKTLTYRGVTDAFNEKFGTELAASQIRAAIKNRRIQSGRTGRFVKGQQSWNAGVSYQPSGASLKTRFKKGNRPHNWVPVGTERYTTKDRFIKVKVAEPNKWKFKHRLVYEQHYGAIPKGKTVVFKDGNRENCSPDNLELIDRGTLAQYNKMRGHSLPPELRTSIRTVAAIKVVASRRMREDESRQEANG